MNPIVILDDCLTPVRRLVVGAGQGRASTHAKHRRVRSFAGNGQCPSLPAYGRRCSAGPMVCGGRVVGRAGKNVHRQHCARHPRVPVERQAGILSTRRRSVEPRSPWRLVSVEWSGVTPTAVRGISSSLREDWSGRRDSNPRPQPWQGCALPLSYARSGAVCRLLLRATVWVRRATSSACRGLQQQSYKNSNTISAWRLDH